MNKNIILIFIIISLGLCFACKKYRIKRKACESDPIDIKFDGGYFYIPNVFTPNQDVINDILFVKDSNVSSYEITIKNKIGKTIFNSDKHVFWDGKYKNKEVKDGIYSIAVKVTTNSGLKFNEKSKVTLIRDVYLIDNCNACCPMGEFDVVLMNCK